MQQECGRGHPGAHLHSGTRVLCGEKRATPMLLSLLVCHMCGTCVSLCVEHVCVSMCGTCVSLCVMCQWNADGLTWPPSVLGLESQGFCTFSYSPSSPCCH